MSEKQTVAGAYARIESHEALCALQYKGIRDDIAELKGLVQAILGVVVSVFLGLLAWMAIQLYTLNNARLDRLEAPAVVHAGVS